MKTKLALLFGVFVVSIVLLMMMRDSWTLRPFQSVEQYTNISRVMMDNEGAMYSIAHSKKIVQKVNAEGILVFRYGSQNAMQANAVYMFNAVAADDVGNSYVLETKLDSYGLKVLGERIIQLSPSGDLRAVLYEQVYPVSDLYRIGNVQTMWIEQGELFFFRKESSNEASLMKLPLAPSAVVEPEIVTTVTLPKETVINELIRYTATSFLATTKQGQLYIIEGSRLMPQHLTATPAELNFPLSIATDGTGAIYYVDNHDQAIKQKMVMRTDSGEMVEKKATVWMGTAQFMQNSADTEGALISHLSIYGEQMLVATANMIYVLQLDGTVTASLDKYRYPAMEQGKKILCWLLLLIAVTTFIVLLRVLYIDVMKRMLSLLLKHLLVILPIVLLSMAGLSYSVYTSFSSEMKADTYKQLQILAANGQYLIDGEMLERLDRLQDYGNSDYMAMKTRINEVFSRAGEDRSGLYNTIYRYMDGKLYIVMDDDDSVPMFEPFALNEENERVIAEGDIIVGEWEDALGEWMYALGPIYHANGEIIGIYETGKDMTGVNQSKQNILYDVFKIFALIGFILLTIITIMTIYLLSSLRTLRRNVNLIAGGQWDVRVDIRSRDEIEELGDRFNMMAGSISQYVQEVTKLSSAYFRFVPQQFLKVLGKTRMADIKLGEQQQRHMTILVCNMRQFGELSSQLSTEENFKFINSFLNYFGPTIREHGGFTIRYLGAGMLTMFPSGADAALQAAGELRERLQQFNKDRENRQLSPIDISIAIHTGDVMLGIIGEEQRMEGSVVSNHVQLALDLEKVSPKLGVTVLLTEETKQSLRAVDHDHIRKLGWIELDIDGKAEPLYDWYAGDPEHNRELKYETKQQFERAIEAFNAGRFYDAREGFVAVVRKNRDDLIAKHYFFACDRLLQQGAANQQQIALRMYGLDS
ncbi:adenylate/guanylate cyclase domain-containing protein [Paenibacillus yanchengensis]|uniref:Adenylate/guanylate cyclase domain-containing protein n=1 Tax=Paenibacillus yanchengensis TaxID=2035833 RepID=A0ABW4YER9_9BACL